jgi:hypothetical protein
VPLTHPRPWAKSAIVSLVSGDLDTAVEADDEQRFLQTITTELTPEQCQRLVTPARAYPRQESVLAVHWHPEHIPFSIIEQRLATLFPNRQEELIIPTQHNELLVHQGYAGVEVDCYSHGFDRKVQLLIHMEESRLERAGVFKAALAHTFEYRASQLFEFMHTITRPHHERLNEAARESGADEDVVRFVRLHTRKVELLIDQYYNKVPRAVFKNKLLRDYFDALRTDHDDLLITRAQNFLRAVKAIVKSHFSNRFFYRTSEIIEEARSLGAGIIIPHPEQFWPILLAEYDVDGIEVWNPQSQLYTDFLISVLTRKNQQLQGPSSRRLLVFMGDDTHLSEKAKAPDQQDAVKAGREIGVQPGWEDLSIRKRLIMADMDRHTIINEYRQRLAG